MNIKEKLKAINAFILDNQLRNKYKQHINKFEYKEQEKQSLVSKIKRIQF